MKRVPEHMIFHKNDKRGTTNMYREEMTCRCKSKRGGRNGT